MLGLADTLNWLHTLWFGYVWPSCTGNGPESIVEIVIGVIVWQKLLGPRVKAWHKHELEKHHDAMKAHVASEIAKLSAPLPLPKRDRRSTGRTAGTPRSEAT